MWFVVRVCQGLLCGVSRWGLATKGTIRKEMGPITLVTLVLVSTPTTVQRLAESTTIPERLSF